ncbi:MAG: protoporphyrinogen oxidase [Planctomycetaceae bacterium]
MKVAILGGGISGLAAAFHLGGVAEATVFESGAQPGGNIRTEEFLGCRVEWGPNGFLDNEPATLDLVRRLGLENRLVGSRTEASRRFVWRAGKLRLLPATPREFLRSDCLSLFGRIRVALERFCRPAPGTDESVAEFAKRHLGKEAAAVLVDAFVTGIFAGDPARLSLESAFPRLRALERTHGSLLKGSKGRGFGPPGRLTSFDGGMEVLVSALAERVDVRLGAAAEEVELGEYGRVLCTLPAPKAAPLFGGELGELLGRIPTSPVAVVALVLREPAPAPDAFGFLAPRGQGLRILGTLYDSSIFPGRAPAGLRLFRALVGGRRDPDAVGASDTELLEIVARDLRKAWGSFPEPLGVRVVRHPVGIPQYEVGHADLLARIDRARPPWLRLAGSSYRGVALNACIKEALDWTP